PADGPDRADHPAELLHRVALELLDQCGELLLCPRVLEGADVLEVLHPPSAPGLVPPQVDVVPVPDPPQPHALAKSHDVGNDLVLFKTNTEVAESTRRG